MKSGKRFLLCVALALPVFTFAAVSAPPAGLPELLSSKGPFLNAWKRMFNGEKNVPRWLRQAAGVASPSATISAAGGEYIVGYMCKPHDCSNNRFFGAFGKGDKAWGLLVTVRDVPDAIQHPARNAIYRWFGKPDEAIRKILMDQIKTDPDWK